MARNLAFRARRAKNPPLPRPDRPQPRQLRRSSAPQSLNDPVDRAIHLIRRVSGFHLLPFAFLNR
jgi:hypothetical protein